MKTVIAREKVSENRSRAFERCEGVSLVNHTKLKIEVELSKECEGESPIICSLLIEYIFNYDTSTSKMTHQWRI